jgi:hypothetical protein
MIQYMVHVASYSAGEEYVTYDVIAKPEFSLLTSPSSVTLTLVPWPISVLRRPFGWTVFLFLSPWMHALVKEKPLIVTRWLMIISHQPHEPPICRQYWPVIQHMHLHSCLYNYSPEQLNLSWCINTIETQFLLHAYKKHKGGITDMNKPTPVIAP